MRKAPLVVLLLGLVACPRSPAHPWPAGRGTGWRCTARATTWAYVSSCDRHARYVDHPPTSHRIAPCGASPIAGDSVTVDQAACFRYQAEGITQTVCSARMDDCLATRQRLVSSPRTFVWFERALLDAPEEACIRPVNDVSDASVHLGAVTACEWWD
jgi:hypothetical protein